MTTLARLGPVGLSVLTAPEARGVRTPALVRRSDPEHYGLCLVTANDIHFVQRDRECRVGTDDLVLYDTAQPFDCHAAVPGTGPGTMLVLHLPKAGLPLRPQRLNDFLARRLPAGAAMNAILARYLTGITTAIENGEVGEREAKRLGEVALDLAGVALAAEADAGADDCQTPEARRRALLARIEAFIEHNLADPDLAPATIAAHHHISVSHLHRLFQSRDRSVAAWIRCQRLQRARAALADPGLRALTVQLIATRSGFRHPADFSRAFRAAYGVPPGDYRQRAARA
jgi:AraC-like DNA-binding protein